MLRARCAAVVFYILVFGVTVCAPLPASAEVYGRNSYGSCSYQACQSSTQTTLPSGLEISVNLADGQVLPRDGYDVIVTPLNGRGRSFAYADFYIDGELVGPQIQPAENGTASWRWDPGTKGRATIKVVVTDTDGSTVAKEFHVTVGQAAANSPFLQKQEVVKPTGLNALLQNAAETTERVIKALPRPVVYAFPYILFVLLGCNAVLLLWQARRELKEYRTTQALLDRLQLMSEGKKTFLGLVSHYLRTPLTLVAGGVEMLGQDPQAKARIAHLQAAERQLQANIEKLIAQLNVKGTPTPAKGLSVTTRPWLQPGLYVPIVCIGFAGFVLTYLTSRVDTFTITQINVLAQLLAFGIAACMSYQMFRNRQLRRRDAERLRQVMGQETAASQARDNLIAQVTATLNADIKRLDDLLAPMAHSASATFATNGQARLHQLMDKMILVTTLRGAHSDNPPKQLSLGMILSHIQLNKGVGLAVNNPDAAVNVSEPLLFSFAVRSVIDNAVAYSPERGDVAVHIMQDTRGTMVRVTDAGPGIPAKQQQMLFQPFFKAEGAERFTHEGIGLSLYIDKLIMMYLGGSIEVESAPGNTTVSLCLPNPRRLDVRR